jgi:hypothetical protein
MINLEGVVAAKWQDVPATEVFPGIRRRVLWRGANGAKAQMLEIDAGATFPKLAGSAHVPQSTQGCVLFVFFPEG